MAMLNKMRRLWPARARAGEPSPTVAPNERIYAVGDIHGRADLLLRLHKHIQLDADIYTTDKTKKIIYLGDYIDRGHDSRAVVEILSGKPLRGFDQVFLKGNHEDLLLRLLQDPDIWSQWCAVGGDATAWSYGVELETAEGGAAESVEQLVRQVPPDHWRFFEELQMYCRSGDYLFVHAGIRPKVPLELQTPHDLMWIRDDFLRHRGPLGVVVVHGHSISLRPEVLPGRIGIDTGAYATNALSCVVLDGTHRRFISTGSVDLFPAPG